MRRLYPAKAIAQQCIKTAGLQVGLSYNKAAIPLQPLLCGSTTALLVSHDAGRAFWLSPEVR